MSFQDKSIQCSDCGTTFTFSTGEQEFYSARGYTNEPKRCAPCRQARKTERNGNGNGNGNGYGNGNGSYSAPRQMFAVTCAECGRDTQVPFEPRGNGPLYCSDCYRKVRLTR
jgi:CxxC-x17-CxxC domain-containing protein